MRCLKEKQAGKGIVTGRIGEMIGDVREQGPELFKAKHIAETSSIEKQTQQQEPSIIRAEIPSIKVGYHNNLSNKS